MNMEKVGRRLFLKRGARAGVGAAAGAVALNEVSPAIWRQEPSFAANQSYWVKSQPAANPALADDLEADVAIIGGGFTGLSSAYYICKHSPGKQVVVLLSLIHI